MSSPSYYDDGNFTIAQQNGPWLFAFPFSEKGDSSTFTATRKVRQKATAIKKPALMSKLNFNLGTTYLVSISETKDVSNGLVEWEEIWASVPVSRREYGSITYTLQDLHITFSSAGRTPTLLEYTTTRDAAFLYEYSVGKPLPRRIAPVVVIQNVEGSQSIYGFGGWGTFTTGTEILAQDTTSSIYIGKIYERRSVLIEYQPFVSLI